MAPRFTNPLGPQDALLKHSLLYDASSLWHTLEDLLVLGNLQKYKILPGKTVDVRLN